MPIRRHVGAKQVGRTTATAFLLNSTYQVLKSRPRNFLGLNHDGPQRVYHFVELFLRKKRSSRTLSINCGSRVVLGLKWFECLLVKTSSFPCAKDSEPNHVTVFLACKAAPNSRTSSLFRQLYMTIFGVEFSTFDASIFDTVTRTDHSWRRTVARERTARGCRCVTVEFD